ncbi:MAG: transcriptional regulator [Candidatus Hadarchaeales archaeon]
MESIRSLLAEYLKINRTVHEPPRFAILELLAVCGRTDYTTIKETLGLSDGNLHNHLSKLEREGYIRVRKGFSGRRPKTEYEITEEGLKTLSAYLDQTIQTLKSLEEKLRSMH